MAKNKTNVTDENVLQFIKEFADTEQRRNDSYELIKLIQSISGHKPKMWALSGLEAIITSTTAVMREKLHC